MKPGLLTTELWLAVATIVVTYTGVAPTTANENNVAMGLAAVYALARTWLKVKVPALPAASSTASIKGLISTLLGPQTPVKPAAVQPPPPPQG